MLAARMYKCHFECTILTSILSVLHISNTCSLLAPPVVVLFAKKVQENSVKDVLGGTQLIKNLVV